MYNVTFAFRFRREQSLLFQVFSLQNKTTQKFDSGGMKLSLNDVYLRHHCSRNAQVKFNI